MRHRIIIFILTFLSTFRLIAQHTNISGSLNDFSFDIYRQIKSDKDNLFFSPLSIDFALLMAKEGSKSDTKAGFEKVLHLDSKLNNKDALDFVLNLKNFIDSSNYMTISNAIWIQKGFNINSDYKNIIQSNYSADAFIVNFLQKNESANQINNWVAKKTNNLIKEIISPNSIEDSTKLVLTNAIYFIGKWSDEFNKNITKKDNFYSIMYDTLKIDFMHKTEHLSYFENTDFQFMSKYYKGNDKSFCVILPKKRYGISSIETMLKKSLLDSIFRNIVSNEVELTLPKFKIETNYSLNDALITLGLKKAFSDYADFSGISKNPRLKISDVSHMAYIKIDEEKTEAAAVTGLRMMVASSAKGPKPKPKIFKADHPFVFMIIDNKTKGIIFIGKYVKEK